MKLTNTGKTTGTTSSRGSDLTINIPVMLFQPTIKILSFFENIYYSSIRDILDSLTISPTFDPPNFNRAVHTRESPLVNPSDTRSSIKLFSFSFYINYPLVGSEHLIVVFSISKYEQRK